MENIENIENMEKKILEHLLTVLDTSRREDTPGGMSFIDEKEIMEIKNNRTKFVEPDYHRPWHKLNKTQKMNRLIIYTQKLTKDYSLTIKEELQLKQLIKSLFNIDNIEDIEYEEGQMVKILNLQRATEEPYEFYLASIKSNKPTETITLENTMTIPLSLSELLTVNAPPPVSAEPVKKKKLIIKRKVPVV